MYTSLQKMQTYLETCLRPQIFVKICKFKRRQIFKCNFVHTYHAKGI